MDRPCIRKYWVTGNIYGMRGSRKMTECCSKCGKELGRVKAKTSGCSVPTTDETGRVRFLEDSSSRTCFLCRLIIVKYFRTYGWPYLTWPDLPCGVQDVSLGILPLWPKVCEIRANGIKKKQKGKVFVDIPERNWIVINDRNIIVMIFLLRTDNLWTFTAIKIETDAVILRLIMVPSI